MKSWILSVALLAPSLAFGQIAFEVASIKPSDPQEEGRIMMRMGTDAGMLRYTNVALKDCIRVAYRVKDFQVVGPDWIGSTRYDIVAKLPAGSSEDQIPEMLQQLLAERFKLVVHRDTKDHAIYALIVGKGGAKLKPAEVTSSNAAPAGGPGRGGPPRGGMMVTVDGDGAHLKAPSATLASLGELISRFSERPIVDMTGIQGRFDFDLVFSPETLRGVTGGGGGGRAMMAPGGGGGPAPADGASDRAGSIYDSVQRYGLKLEARKAAMEVITVDQMEQRPTEN